MTNNLLNSGNYAFIEHYISLCVVSWYPEWLFRTLERILSYTQLLKMVLSTVKYNNSCEKKTLFLPEIKIIIENLAETFKKYYYLLKINILSNNEIFPLTTETIDRDFYQIRESIRQLSYYLIF